MSLVTLGTSIWLLSCVNPIMNLQRTTLCKWFFTLGTIKWLLSCVDPFMIFKSQLSVNDWSHFEQVSGVLHALWKCHSSWMSFHISNRQMASLLCGSFQDFQITTICKWLVTFGTGKGERLGMSGIPVFQELKYPGKLTPLFANNAQNIKPFTFHASGLFFKVEFLLDTQPFIFLENKLTTDGASA